MSKPLPDHFASYCPECGTGDPGEDYCSSCGVRLSPKDECCHGVEDVCVASGCLMGIPGGEHG